LTKQFVITGPESTGKSTLTKILAQEYNASWVKEYARDYLSTLRHAQGDISYTFEDVIEMAKIQLQKEQEAISQNELLFLDTDLTVFYVWIKEKYNQEVDWINEHLAQAQNKIYLLCDVDLEWEDDPLREHPKLEDRLRLYESYKSLLAANNLTYYVLSGDKIAREKKAKEIINKLI
jgi:NadR type nicotinamide-nucleotide adenylyltransferase